MKLLSAKLHGLIGVCRASGLHEIFIDFTKCKHNICLIIGKNGSGKSTIMNALHPFPDSQQNFLEGEEGLKELKYLANDGTIYTCTIVYPINKYGDRLTTKAFLKKDSGEGEIELNTNGNISSYKELLYLEFKLDAAFVALSHISVENRGLVDMTPAERKKFVGNIIDRVEAYNIIYKAMNKRSSAFKSLINTITAKIDTIGDEEHLLSKQDALSYRIDYLEKQRTTISKGIAEAETLIKVVDPTGQIQDLYRELYSQSKSIKSRIATISLFLENKGDNITSSKECNTIIKSKETKMNEIAGEISYLQSKIRDSIVAKEEQARAIQLKTERLQSLQSEYNYQTLESEIERLETNIEKYLATFKQIGIDVRKALTKDEFATGLNILRDIKEQVDALRSYHYEHELEVAVKYIIDGTNVLDLINSKQDHIGEIDDMIYEYLAKLNHLEKLSGRISILANRPEKCSIGTCAFIKDALDAKKEYDEYPENIETVNATLANLQQDKVLLESELKQLKTISKISTHVQIIYRYIQTNSAILNKLPNGSVYSDINIFFNKLLQGNTFNEINTLYAHIDKVNMFELYQYEKNMLEKLQAEYKIYQSKSSLIDEIQKDIDDIMEKLTSLDQTISSQNATIYNLQAEQLGLEQEISHLDSLKAKFEEKEALENSYNDLEKKLTEIASNMAKIESCVQTINNLESEMKTVESELNPLKDEKDQIKFSLTMLKEYKAEMSIYEKKYEKTELIKKYSSPTKDGIQNLFIEIYMGQTINMANKLLGQMFNGTLQLGKYIINEKEFRIPCISMESPIPNDDISSCSTSQRCMISMILGFALLKQGSSKYNILRLDEIDHGLDQDNRALFISVVRSIMADMGVESCIMVSHATESVLDDTDVILLNPLDNVQPKGNVIFKYDDMKNPYAE